MSRACDFSKETIKGCYERARKYEAVLRGEMAMDVSNDLNSMKNILHELEGNIKDLEQLENKIKDIKQLTVDFLKEKRDRREEIQKDIEPTLVTQSTDKPDAEDDESELPVTERHSNIQPTNGGGCAFNHTK